MTAISLVQPQPQQIDARRGSGAATTTGLAGIAILRGLPPAWSKMRSMSRRRTRMSGFGRAVVARTVLLVSPICDARARLS